MIFKVVFTSINIGIFILGLFIQKDNTELSNLNRLGYSVYISRGAGLCLSILPFFIFISVCHRFTTFLSKYITILKNIFPEHSFYFHKSCSYALFFFVLLHSFCHYLNFYGLQNRLQHNTMYNLHYTTLSGISGHIMIISLIFIFVFSGRYFRKYKYEIFWYSHHLFILFLIVYPFHGLGCIVKTNSGKCLPYYSIYISLPAILIYIIERVYRETRPTQKIIDHVFNDDNNMLKIYVEKKIDFKAGQYILINCPKISKFQWHAFTISSSPENSTSYIEITIKCLGNWTHRLYEELRCNSEQLHVKIDGAFGTPIDSAYNYDSLILVASGIGITPYISILRKIKSDHIKNKLKIKKIDLIWINRDSASLNWFNEELLDLERSLPQNILKFHMYITDIKMNMKIIESIYKDIHYLNKIYKTNINVNYGRPDFDKLFYEYTVNNKGLNVGCFVCGNNSISTIVNKQCYKYSNKNIKFNFKSEYFEH